MNFFVVAIILLIYGLIILGIYKYNVLHFVQFQSRNEMILIALATLGVILKLLIDCTKTLAVSFETTNFLDLNCFLLSVFNSNSAVISFFTFSVTFVPAILFQMLFLDELFRKYGLDRMALFFYVVCYLINPFVFISINITIPELLLYLLINAFILFLVLTLKDSLTLKTELYLVAILICIVFIAIIQSSININLYVASLITIAECVLLGIYRTKSIILRSGLRYLGTLIILVAIVIFNGRIL